MKKKTSYLIISIIIVASVVLDLVTKIIFANLLKGITEELVVIPNFFTFTYLENTGAAYGMFGNSTLGLTIVSVIFIVAFVVYDYFYHNNSKWYLVAFSMIVGGAVGNLIDRIFLGYVRDFISIKLFSFVFNLADLFITIGVICFVIYIIISTINEHKSGKKKDEVDSKK